MSKREQSDELAPCRSPGANSLADNCNRRPFLSEGDCDRGDVDVHQFDDLPFCDPINPTPPDVPPQVLETQWNLNVPPPCACIDIAYKFKFNGFTKNEDMNAKGTFKSTGDCCEGEYETGFEFDLPCPISDFDKKEFKVKTGWNCETTHEQTYIEPSKDECGLDPQDIDFTIGLPCPIDGNGEKNIQIKLDWDNDKESSKPYLSARNEAECDDSEENCQITPNDVEFNLGLPCPIPEGAQATISAAMAWGCSSKSDAVVVVKRKEDECALEMEEAELVLGLPCPIGGSSGDKCISIDMKWDGQQTQKLAYLSSKNEADCAGGAPGGGSGGADDCQITPEEPEFMIGLPCPIPDKKISKDISIAINWNKVDSECKPSTQKLSLKRDKECELAFDDASVDFSLCLPCPVPEDVSDQKKKIKIDWTPNGDDSKKENEQPLVQKSGDCAIEVEQTDFEIGLPCPLPDNLADQKKKIKIEWTPNGDDSKKENEQPLVQKSDDCTIEVNTDQFEIGLPCPLPDNLADQKKKIKIDWTPNGDGSRQESEKSIIQKSDDCTVEVNTDQFEIGLPCPLPDNLADQKKKIKIDWTPNGDDSKKENEQPLVQKSDYCTIEVNTDQFDIGLPCPMPDEEKTLKIGLDWKDKKTDSQTVLKKDSNDCSIDMSEVAFDLGLPCPIPQDPLSASIKLKYGKEFKGDKQNIAHSSAGDCKLEADTPTFDLEIPCPLDSLEFDASLQESSGNWELAVVPKTDSGGDEGCSKGFEIRLFVPEYQTLTVITGIGFDPSTMAITYTTAEISGRFSITGTSSGYETLPTATHVNKCC